MVHPFPRHGFKMWATLGVLSGAAILSFGSVSLFLFLYTHAHDSMRDVWGFALLLSVVLIWGVAFAEIRMIFSQERFLFDDQISAFKRQHPKGARIARLWFFCLAWVIAMTLGAYFTLVPGRIEHNFMVAAIAVVFDSSIILYAFKRTRKILRRRWSMHSGYGR